MLAKVALCPLLCDFYCTVDAKRFEMDQKKEMFSKKTFDFEINIFHDILNKIGSYFHCLHLQKSRKGQKRPVL